MPDLMIRSADGWRPRVGSNRPSAASREELPRKRIAKIRKEVVACSQPQGGGSSDLIRRFISHSGPGRLYQRCPGFFMGIKLLNTLDSPGSRRVPLEVACISVPTHRSDPASGIPRKAPIRNHRSIRCTVLWDRSSDRRLRLRTDRHCR